MHWGQPTRGCWWVGGDPSRTKHERRSPLFSCTAYKVQRLLGQTNWLQSRTQFQCCYKFSWCASMAASPTIGDVKVPDKLARQLKSQPLELQFWPLTGPLRIIGFPGASYRNNEDGFLAESRELSSKDGISLKKIWLTMKAKKIKKDCALHYCGWAVFFHEVFWFMPVLWGLWMDLSSEDANIHWGLAQRTW